MSHMSSCKKGIAGASTIQISQNVSLEWLRQLPQKKQPTKQTGPVPTLQGTSYGFDLLLLG